MLVQTKVTDEEPVVFDTGYLHSWGSRVMGLHIRANYTSSLGSRVHFPRALLAAEYGDTEVFQFVSTLAVNPYTWGFTDGMLVTSELVRVAFAFVNGTYLAVSGLRPTENIEVELTHGTSRPERIWTGKTIAVKTSSSTSVFNNISSTELDNPIELRPTESKFTLINVSMLITDGVALAAEFRAYGAFEGDSVANSSTVLLEVFFGYTQVAHRYQYDSFEALPLTWNTTSRRYELLRYIFLPLQ